MDLLHVAARVWSEQRIPETRSACLWRGAVLEQAEHWVAVTTEPLSVDVIAFLEACHKEQKDVSQRLDLLSTSTHKGYLEAVTEGARSVVGVACDGPARMFFSAEWPEEGAIHAAQYQRWLEVSGSVLLAALVWLWTCL